MIIDENMLKTVKLNEGCIEYQTKMKYFRAGRFFVYKDSLGFDTIGYGHLCTSAEVQKYKQGISEIDANNLLALDLGKAEQGARRLFQMNRHSTQVQRVLVEMVFQLGESKAAQFKKFKMQLEAKEYKLAAGELKNSNWFRQTPNRVQGHINVLLKE